MGKLQLRGELNRDTGLPPYEWRTDEGINVTIDGRIVTVEWPDPPEGTIGEINKMAEHVADRFAYREP